MNVSGSMNAFIRGHAVLVGVQRTRQAMAPYTADSAGACMDAAQGATRRSHQPWPVKPHTATPAGGSFMQGASMTAVSAGQHTITMQ